MLVFIFLGCIKYIINFKKRAFLKYVSSSPGQLPFPHLCLNRHIPSYLLTIPYQGNPWANTTLLGEPAQFCAWARGQLNLFFLYFRFFIYFKVLSHTFHPQNNSESVWYSSLDRWWKTKSSQLTFIDHSTMYHLQREALYACFLT